MRASTENSILFLVPEINLIAGEVENIRTFFIDKLKENPGIQTVVLDVEGIDIVDSLGVNLIIGLYKEVTATSRQFSIKNAGAKFMKIAHFFRFPSLFTIEGGEKK